MKQENLDELKNIYLGLVTGEEQLLNEAPGGKARFWDSKMGKFVTKVSNVARSAGEYLAPSPARSAEPSVRAGVRTPQTGFSHALSMDGVPTRPTQRETPAQREARIEISQNAAIAAATETEAEAARKAKAKAARKAEAEAARKAEAEAARKANAESPTPESPTPPRGATPTPPRPAASSTAPKPTAAPAKPMGGAPMDQWARANPTLATKVKPGQSGYDTIKTRLSADNDSGPSTPTPSSSSSSTTSGSSSSSGETDRLKKALDIKKSDVTSSYQWPSVKTLKNIADAYSSVYEKKEYEPSRDQDKDGDNDFADNMIARMVASGMSREEAIKKVKNKDYNKKNGLDEATAMAKRGLNEPAIRQKIAKSTGGGKAADRATALEKQPTYGDANKATQRQKYARAQRGDFRDTTSSDPGLRGYAYQSDDPEVKAKQAARGAQRSALTPREKKQLNREAYEIYELVASYLLENNFVSTIKDANIVIENMSENWFNQIIKEEIN